MNKKLLAMILLVAIVMGSFAYLPGVAVAGTQSGTYTFSESGLDSGVTWSVKVTDISTGSVLATVSGSTSTLSYSYSGNGFDQLEFQSEDATEIQNTVDGQYTTTYVTSASYLPGTVGTYSFSYSNTLFYSWSETGLGSGVNFGVTYSDTLGGSYGGTLSGSQSYNNIQIGSSATSPSLPIGNGMNFAWTVTIPSGYTASPTGGQFDSTGSSSIAFSLITYTDTFQESGLPSGTLWGLELSTGTLYSTTGTSISVNFNINTQYTYTIQGVAGFAITSGSTGTLQSGTTSVTYASIAGTDIFSETGLKSGTQWGVYANNTWHYSTTGTISISFNEGTGPWNYTVQTVAGYGTPSPQTGNLNTTQNVAVTYAPITYYNHFNETGLLPGTPWTVTSNSHSYFSSSSSIAVPFNLVNQSTYRISSVSGYILNSPATGNVAAGTTNVSFSKIAGTITYTETGLPNGTTWGMNFNGTQKYANAGSTISFNESTGTFLSTASTNDSYWYKQQFNDVIPIGISTNSPNASLTYQQEIQIPTGGRLDSSLGNQLFTFSNGTKAYAWIQSYNSTSQVETVWVKMYSEVNQTLSWRIYSSGFDWLNASGYLGKSNSTTDNGYRVFRVYANQTSFPFSSFSLIGGAYPSFSDGYLNASAGCVLANSSFSAANGRLLFNGWLTDSGLYQRLGFVQSESTSLYNGTYISGNRHYGIGGVYYASGGFNYFGLNTLSVTGNSSHAFQLYVNGNTISQFVDGTLYTLTEPIGNSLSKMGLWLSANSGDMFEKYMAYATVPNNTMPSASVGSSYVTVTGNATYNINFEQYRYNLTFHAEGLTGNIGFYVLHNGTKYYGTNAQNASFNIANVTVTNFSYKATSGWFTPTSNNVTITFLQNATFNVLFYENTFVINIIEHGLPVGTQWYVTYNGVIYKSTSNTIQLTVPLGDASFLVGISGNYYINPHAWESYISSNSTYVNVTFTPNGGGANYVTYMPYTVISLVLVLPVMFFFLIRWMRRQKE